MNTIIFYKIFKIRKTSLKDPLKIENCEVILSKTETIFLKKKEDKK